MRNICKYVGAYLVYAPQNNRKHFIFYKKNPQFTYPLFQKIRIFVKRIPTAHVHSRRGFRNRTFIDANLQLTNFATLSSGRGNGNVTSTFVVYIGYCTRCSICLYIFPRRGLLRCLSHPMKAMRRPVNCGISGCKNSHVFFCIIPNLGREEDNKSKNKWTYLKKSELATLQ